MNEDTGVPSVDWVSVMFHAAKEIGAENRRLRAENQGLTGQVQRQAELLGIISTVAWREADGTGREPDIEKFIKALVLDHVAFSRIRKMYEEHPYASAKPIDSVLDEMITLWENDNVPF